jgi:membrane protease YdiL (CAAX protease family)
LRAASPAPRSIFFALAVWAGSVAALFLFQFVALLIYSGARLLIASEKPVQQLTPGLALAALAGTFAAHVVTLVGCWFIVTSGGVRPFLATLGWRWHHQFKWIHAVALALAMLGLGFAFEKILPHGETDFERLLQLSTSVRVAVALLAVFSAPIVEEVVYRGILYTSLAEARGWKFAVVLVTILFAVVHAPQYWGSMAALAAILTLSLVLTLLRAATRQLLPCIATHLIFNGVQAIVLIIAPPTRTESTPGAVHLILRAIGIEI